MRIHLVTILVALIGSAALPSAFALQGNPLIGVWQQVKEKAATMPPGVVEYTPA